MSEFIKIDKNIFDVSEISAIRSEDLSGARTIYKIILYVAGIRHEIVYRQEEDRNAEFDKLARRFVKRQ